MHAHAAAVSAAKDAEIAGLRAELLKSLADNAALRADAIDRQNNVVAPLRARVRVLEDALRHIDKECFSHAVVWLCADTRSQQMSITLPPPPIRSCIVTYMGDGRGLHYTLGVAAGTALIEQPPGSQLDLYTADQLRARDLEVARVALKAAADLVDGNAAYCSGQTAAILGSNADAIRALEVKHG